MNLSSIYIQNLFKKTPRQLCRHALSLDATGADEFWFTCGVIGAKLGHEVAGLRVASLAQDIPAAREILKNLEASL